MVFNRSYFPNYFSLEDIMVTEERIPCKTQNVIRRLGFLIPGSGKEDIGQDEQLEVPLWLVLKLIEQKRKDLKMDIPKIYKEKTRDVFEADAKVINLFRVNPHYYEFGNYVSRLNHRESKLILEIIIQTFQDRFRIIIDWADNIMTEPSKVQQLDTSERSLLKMGHKSRMMLDAWLVDGASQMKAAEMVMNLKKRKLMALENE